MLNGVVHVADDGSVLFEPFSREGGPFKASGRAAQAPGPQNGGGCMKSALGGGGTRGDGGGARLEKLATDEAGSKRFRVLILSTRGSRRGRCRGVWPKGFG